MLAVHAEPPTPRPLLCGICDLPIVAEFNICERCYMPRHRECEHAPHTYRIHGTGIETVCGAHIEVPA